MMPFTSSAVDVLAFGPHPDDVELFCGGLMARMHQLGYRTGVVDLTRGEKSSRGTPETRAAETQKATEVLGLCLRENLGLPDGAIDAAGPLDTLVPLLRRLRPELVILPWERERHPDHEAASALLSRALFFASVKNMHPTPDLPPFTPRQVIYYPLRQLANPTVIVDTTAAHATKLAAIRCYQSQVEARPDAPPTLVGSPLSLSSLEARDAFYGAHIGTAYGEPYVLREALGLVDPVDHFRRNAFARPLFFPPTP